MTAPAAVAAEPVAEEPATPSTTARTLRRLRAALVAGSLLTGALCVVVSSQAHAGAEAAGERAAPAVLRAEAAYAALVDAQRMAVHGFRQGTVLLGGLGDRYRNDIAAINQNLAELAGYNAAGPAAAGDLQVIEGLVVDYNAEIEQAAADYQQTGELAHALPALWYAGLEYQEISGRLDRLRQEEKAALTDRRDSVWLAGAADLLFLVPFALVLALFAWTQLVLRRRFRRRVSPWLAAAVLALTATALWCGQSLHGSDGRLRSALDGPFVEAVTLAQQQAGRSAAEAEAGLFALVAPACPTTTRPCGTHLTPPASEPATVETEQEGRQQAQAEVAFTDDVTKVDADFPLRQVIVVALPLAAAVAAVFALHRRIGEYRFGGR
ncbi:hypothetical protein ACFVFS_20890 [Kitasatospora sp. NPDC057692]|uniref:hypothetical protein n=1 Tax=Kitasatospora sp. NPDC057692 TaxID=3346215 RepID=UPI0036C21592